MPNVIKAHTVLIVSFEITEDGEDDARWESRVFPSGASLGAWERSEDADLSGTLWEPARRRRPPNEAAELDKGLAGLLDVPIEPGGSGPGSTPWRLRRLQASQSALSLLQSFRLVLLGNASLTPEDWCPDLEHVEIWRFPARAGFVVLHFAWTCTPDAPMDIAEFGDRLATLRNARVEKGQGANMPRWRGFRTAKQVIGHDYLGALEPAMLLPGEPVGATLSRKQREARVVDLRTLVTWLLQDPQAGVLGKPSPSQAARHHTCVVLDGALEELPLHEALFRLGRAVDRRHLPPPADEPGADRTLRVRANRALRLCREGIVSLGWPVEEDRGKDWEYAGWPARFVAGQKTWGIYFSLALAARAERDALSELTRRVADHVARQRPSAPTLRELEQTVGLLRELSGYTATLCTEDSGGVSDYAMFYRAVREVLGTPAQLSELREEVRETRDLVVTEYERHSQADDRRFQRDVALLGLTGIGFGIVTGVLGVTLTDGGAPPWAQPSSLGSYFAVLVLATLVSALLILAFAGLQWLRVRGIRSVSPLLARPSGLAERPRPIPLRLPTSRLSDDDGQDEDVDDGTGRARRARASDTQ